MRVTKAQALENRARIVDRASTLFRERGYDGVGVADLMAAAGFTHGGFYKHFRSKVDLMAEAAACGMAQTATRTGGVDIAEFVERYVSRLHRDTPGDGCTMAALCGDAARQPAAVKATFADGIERLLAALEHEREDSSDVAHHQSRAQLIDMIAHAIGAVVLSRACPDDSPLADEVLDVCRAALLAPLAPPPATRTHGHSALPAR